MLLYFVHDIHESQILNITFLNKTVLKSEKYFCMLFQVLFFPTCKERKCPLKTAWTYKYDGKIGFELKCFTPFFPRNHLNFQEIDILCFSSFLDVT